MKDLINEEKFEGRPSTELAIGCFTIGTILFLFFLLLKDNSNILILGFLFVVAAILLNVIVLLHLVHSYFILPNQREYIGGKILILLSNIPIALLYYSMVPKI
ncbi:hypothetical protein LNQ49_21730 [Flavobacterium sp. F-65]|jgi:hypothetical protein|uniref:Uncharacterized protein n=1 Tax=Flavobacterium pisciphilum TaxID=2893755 RepID=A0ABS8MZK8_9FLAO|nr:hypothetical protein [Flavobacterium sp. F-65]MCC9074215.1 hypothetical protein [Flavobacterium sp. F-65]